MKRTAISYELRPETAAAVNEELIRGVFDEPAQLAPDTVRTPPSCSTTG